MAPRTDAPDKPPPRGYDARMRTSIRVVALVGIVLALFGAAFAGLAAGFSVAAGAALAAGN
ncbi:MAG TPA: hypothetical protein VH044_08455, partial [Polyangiaceae bacterium]|nr:hypothetical protein [Polyangiaceae bacterium]